MAAGMLPEYLCLPGIRIRRVFSGGKNERTIEMRKMMTGNGMYILVVSGTREFSASAICDFFEIVLMKSSGFAAMPV